MVDVTFSFDHDLIDGATALWLTTRVKELIEGAYGLESFMWQNNKGEASYLERRRKS